MASNPSKPTKKRARTQNPKSSSQVVIYQGGSSSNPLSSANVNPLLSRGGKSGRIGKPNILDGYYYDGNDLEGTTFWELVKFQKWEKFWLEFDGRSFEYKMRNFREDFGLSSSGFASYAVDMWPPAEEIESAAKLTAILNNGRRFRNGYRKKGVVDTVPCLHLYTGEERFVNTCCVKSLVPVGSQDRNPSRVVNSLTYKFMLRQRINLPIIIAFHMRHSMGNTKATTLPYGMLITHIMESWGGDRVFPRVGG
ncbi:hypothetical protein LIER_41482 [Lithospermum erythrorhizon]|uniref:Uncharacterized protein n=1 Tax=Lithospermum erythrorhizon TaxID=34254 RepID=A0AAV3RD60_LITER